MNPNPHSHRSTLFPNETVFLLDENNRLVTEPDKTANSVVAGTALALGYYRDPKRTAMAFVQNPLNPCYPEIIYRTGDLACYGRDGLLYFNGRKDFQIKHMGHRIELGEIEAALETVEGVDRAVCLFLEEKIRLRPSMRGSRCQKGHRRRPGTSPAALHVPRFIQKPDGTSTY